jgi:YihY family inner membrane protein
MSFIQKWIDRYDAFQRKHPWLGFPLAEVRKYGDDEACHQAALLAYYGFLALFTLLMVLATLVKLFLRGDGDLQHQILQTATDYIPVIGSQLGQNIHGMDKAGLALAVGILLTLFGARGVADVFRGSINHVWQVPYARRTPFPKSLLKSLGIIIFGGIGLLLAPLLAGYATSFGYFWMFRVLALCLTAVILFGVFIFLARTAMSEVRPVKDIWVGALFAAVGIMLLQSLGTYLIAHQLKNLADLYSTFAIVLGLLFWLYLQTQIVLYAIEIDSVRILKLWPRAINTKTRTDGDAAAYRLYAQRNTWHADDEIELHQDTKKRPLLERIRDLGRDDTDE